MVVIFREVRRVLRDDGVLWMNYGDAFEDGNLMMMPHRLAIALQDDGWIVRNDLVWFKRNPMPESVAGWRWERKKIGEKSRQSNAAKQKTHPASYDNINGGSDVVEWEYSDDYVLRKSSWRHTRAHEYVFQLVKKMSYYCNQEAVREALLEASVKRIAKGYDGEFMARARLADPKDKRSHGIDANAVPAGRNPRSVLDVPTAPYKGAHYATFPPKLIAPLIRASVPRRCCPECGQAWAAVVEKSFVGTWDDHSQNLEKGARQDSGGPKSDFERPTVTAYRPTCECGIEDFEPGIVLDIFGGSGTTGMVAKELLRGWVVMDISRPYLDEQSKVRTKTGIPSKALEGLPMFEMELFDDD
jgi:DNA modification methylase